MIEALKKQAIELLKNLIGTPSFSGEEEGTAEHIVQWFKSNNIPYKRDKNNVYAFNKHFREGKPLLLLNSHHDTVKPNTAYTKDPFKAEIDGDILYGLGSNDAGGPLVALLSTFAYFYNKENLSHNIVVVASAEEENSGPNGLNYMTTVLPEIDLAIVGEPTLMDMAIAEKGLIVYDAEISGTPSHAAHPNSNNSIYNSIDVLKWFKDFQFEKESEVLGPVKLTVTQINAGHQHNVVPAHVNLVIDVRVNDCYTNKEIDDILKAQAPCKLKPRSLRLNSSHIDSNHPLVASGIAIGRKTYGSPTMSDQAVLSCQSIKLGPGDSNRSHSADEFIHLSEIEEAIEIYIKILEGFLLK